MIFFIIVSNPAYGDAYSAITQSRNMAEWITPEAVAARQRLLSNKFDSHCSRQNSHCADKGTMNLAALALCYSVSQPAILIRFLLLYISFSGFWSKCEI